MENRNVVLIGVLEKKAFQMKANRLLTIRFGSGVGGLQVKKVENCWVGLWPAPEWPGNTKWTSLNRSGWPSVDRETQLKQVCIPVGCVLPTSWLYLGGCLLRRGVCLPHSIVGRQTLLWADKHVWKHYLYATSFTGSKHYLHANYVKIKVLFV